MPNEVFNKTEFIQELVNKAAKSLYPVNLWTEKQNDGTFKQFMNSKVIPEENLDKIGFSFRFSLLNIPSREWDEIWKLIENRIKYDKYFFVQGFSQEDIIEAVQELKLFFPSTWIKKRYKDAAKILNQPIGMGLKFNPKIQDWYPAYQLVRTAIGAICVDPAWNYLVELGLSLKQMKDVPNINLLTNNLTKNSGDQHTLCLAFDFLKKGYLNEVEPLIGNGKYRNDISLKYDNRIIDIELKAFTSLKPQKQLLREVKKKSEILPSNYDKPLIFHVELMDVGIYCLEKEKLFFEFLDTICLEEYPNITAIVGGRIFIDCSGGLLKRDNDKIIINKHANHKIHQTVLNKIFENNYSEIFYPTYGLNTFMYCENKEHE